MARVILCAVCACDAGSSGSSSENARGAGGGHERGASASAARTQGTDSRYFKYRTTDPQIALRNLDGQIKAAASSPESSRDAKASARLVDLLLLRSTLVGSFDDLQFALQESERALRKHPDERALISSRIQALAAVHQFDAALELLQEYASELGREGQASARSLSVARGEPAPDRVVAADAEAARHSSLHSQSHLGLMLASAGRFEEADRAYQAALDAYRDASPFPVVLVLFQRAMMWAEEANRPERARPLYLAAVRRLPQFVRAQVHLAELELEAQDEKLATRRLRRIVSHTQDPEPAGALAELLLQSETTRADGQALVDKARERYEQLLARHPAAFADHAAEFYLGAGADPKRGLELAEANLQVRATPRARALVAVAAYAAGGQERVCQVKGLEAVRRLPKWRLPTEVWTGLEQCAAKAHR